MSVANAIRNPVSYLGGALHLLRLLLFQPDQFFDEIDSRGLRTEILLVGVVGLLGMVGPYYAYTKLMSPFTTTMAYGEKVHLQTEVQLRLQGQGVEPFLYTVALVWVGFSIAFFLLSWVYNERGRFRHMLKNVAWGVVPIAFGHLLQAAAFAWVASGIQVSTLNPGVWFRTVPRGTVAVQTQYIWGQVTGEDLVIGAGVISLAFYIWSWYIWGYAIRDVRKIETRESFAIAAVPTVLWVAYQALAFTGFL